jgi:hypothetical protein
MAEEKKSDIEQPKETETSKVIEDYGSVAVDLGKLIFGSLVLGSVIRGSLSETILLGAGIVASTVLIVVGIWLKNKNKKNMKG